MALKFNRNFKNGRQSEQFLNDELITLYETLKYLPHHKDDPENQGEMPPAAKLVGALNAQPVDEALNYWDGTKWVPFFKSKFQITDQMLVNICPSNPVYGQLWINNGVLCYFDGSEWHPIKAINMDDSQWSNAAFADFEIVSPLNPSRESTVEVNGHTYVINETVAKDSAVDNYWRYNYDNQLDYHRENEVIAADTEWQPDWFSPELPEPAKIVISDAMKAQFLVPSLKNDRIFLDHDFDMSYEKETSICFHYPLKKVLEKNVSAVHLNPGKLTGIKKRLIKIDKINSTIAVSPYNTEFYGFRNGEYGGSFLIPSETQDWGDYICAGDHIVLNYRANQNFDYILAITYEFTWMKADGSMDKKSPQDLSNSFYVSNLRAPINVHVNGLKLEEASYSINLDNKTFTIHDDAENVSVNAWSPYKKQFGYIRETDLQNRGIIHLREPVHIPLVFVGGCLIHPLYGGLEFSEDKQYIYVPNSGDMNQMLNLQWCVVDLVSDDMDVQYQQFGHVEDTNTYYQSGDEDRFVEPDEMYYAGTLSDTTDERGIYDYVLSGGELRGITEKIIRFDPNKIGPNDGVILFVDGLLVNRDELVIDRDEGVIYLNSVELVEGQEYVLLKDRDGAIYDSSNMLPAFSVGYLSDSLIYINGKLLAEAGCVLTLNNPENEVKKGVVDQEIKYFITNDQTGEGYWAKYNQFTYSWDTELSEDEDKKLSDDDIANICTIIDSYENQLTAVKINIPYSKEDDEVVIYSFKFANDLVDITNMGGAHYLKNDEETGYPIYKIEDHYGYNQGMLNVYRNGVKLIKDIEYEEMPLGTTFQVMVPLEETDVIQYLIDPIEKGYENGHTSIVLTKDDAIQSNIYKVPDELNISLYPGRLTVYINGIRIPNTDWVLTSNKSIMLKYFDYKAVGSANNYPEEDFVDKNGYRIFTVTHTYPDQIMVEIRYDYDRQEKTIYLDPGADLNELFIEENDLNSEILESPDEVLFYLNGQFTGLSRNKNNDYRLDQYNGCIVFQNPDFIEAATRDELKTLFDQNSYIYTAWKRMTGKQSYQPDRKNALTIVWR